MRACLLFDRCLPLLFLFKAFIEEKIIVHIRLKNNLLGRYIYIYTEKRNANNSILFFTVFSFF